LVRDLHKFASDIDGMKIENAVLADARDRLIELQGRIVKDIANMRTDLRALTEMDRYH